MAASKERATLNDTCLLFEKFNFDENAAFQGGWSKIKERLTPQDSLEEQLLRAKLFYFSRCVQPLTQEDFQWWMQSKTRLCTVASCGNSRKVKDDNAADQVSTKEGDSKISNSCVDDLEKLTLDHVLENGTTSEISKPPESSAENLNSQPKTETDALSISRSPNSDTPSSHEPSDPPLSLTEVMRLLQQGEEIPGLVELNIQPTNVEPSKSELCRPKKPWEK